jgi:predicted aldo/keto reductase-like oxidoreductase
VRWLTTETELDAVVIRVRSLDEFADTYSGAGKALRAEDSRAIRMMTERANRETCRLCARCQPQCPQRVPITEILRFERYALDDHDMGKASRLYRRLYTQADACSRCGTCVEACPLHLPIPEKIANVHRLLG